MDERGDNEMGAQVAGGGPVMMMVVTNRCDINTDQGQESSETGQAHLTPVSLGTLPTSSIINTTVCV